MNRSSEDEFSNLQLYENKELITKRRRNTDNYDDDDDDDNDPCCCECACCRCECLISKDKWCVKDPCGIICAIMTWGLILFGEIVVTFVILWPSKDTLYSLVNGIIFNILAFLSVASHLAAMLNDPVIFIIIRIIF